MKLLRSSLLATAFFALSGANAFGAITCVTNNSGICPSVAAQFSVLVTPTTVRITNSGAIASAIDIVYFDPAPDNSITGITVSQESSGVEFELGGNPSNLPSGNNVDPAFVSLFNASSTSNVNRVDNNGEFIVFAATGGNLGDLFQAGLVRIGMHIQSVGRNGESESILLTGSNETVVPEPSTFGLAGMALVGLGFMRRRRS